MLYAYLAVGLIVALWFCFAQIGKLDAGAEHSGISFKLLMLPASLLLWPLIIKKIMKK
jgi:hypothetical protein